MFITTERIDGGGGVAEDGVGRAAVRSYPAPKQLATPTDLRPEEARAVVGAVNPLIADAFALFIKTKNFHWHVAGPHFRDYHLLFDEQAEAILASVDPLAERVRRVGGTTIRSVGHVGRLQRVADNERDFVGPDEMISELLADNLRLAGRLRAAIEVAEQSRDTPTSDLLQEQLNEAEKRVWVLYEISAGGQNP